MATPIDTHVHLYRCFDEGALLDHAARSFRRAAGARAMGTLGALLLTERSGQDHFSRFAALAAAAGKAGGWSVVTTEEPGSLLLEKEEARIALVSGFQVVAEEGIEVLALLTRQRPPEGEPLAQTIDGIRRNGGMPVLPWGVGKWLGKRGKRIKEILREADPASLRLADIAGRPAAWPEPKLLRLARQRGIGILHGSDPLPLPGEYRRPGSAGILLQGAISPVTPAASIRESLAQQRNPDFFGARVSLAGFLRSQLALRLPGRRCEVP